MRIDWRLRIAGKLVLSRLPVGYGVWRKLNLFRHGRMDEVGYATSVFLRHWSRYQQTGVAQRDACALELGPGDSLNSAIIAHAHGVRQIVLVDAVEAATGDIAGYRALIEHLGAQGLPVADLEACGDVSKLLECCNARYLCRGLKSLRQIPDQSVDFLFSHAVLEHVRRGEFVDHLREMFRILKPAGIMSHRVDFKDHLGGALHNLRVSSRYWESPFFAESGFYTNRLRASEILSAMEQAGFSCHVHQQDRWPAPPLARVKLAEEFSGLSEDDLCVSGMDLVCQRAERGA